MTDRPVTLEPGGTARSSATSGLALMAAGAGISILGRFAGGGLDLAKQIAIGRLLGPGLFGLYALAWNLLTIVAIFATLGLENGVIRFAAGFRREDAGAQRSVIVRSVLWATGVSCPIAAVVYALAPWLALQVFKEPAFVSAIRIFGLVLPFMAGLRVASAATRVTQRMQFSVYAEGICQPLASLTLFLLFYLIGWKLFGAILSTIIAFMVAFGLALYYLQRVLPELRSVESRVVTSSGSLLRYSLQTAISGMLGVVISRADVLFVGLFLSASEVGIYQAASRVAMIFGVILNGLSASFAPMIASLYSQQGRTPLGELYIVNTKWGLYIITPLFLAICAAPRELLAVVFGPEYAGGAGPLVILSGGQYVNGVTGAVGYLLIMTGHQTFWLRTTAAVVGVNVLLNCLLIPRLGLPGAAVATSITVSTLFLLGLFQIRRSLHLWPYDRRYLKGVAACLVSAMVIVIVRPVLVVGPTTALVAIMCLSAGVFWGLLLLLGLDREDLELIRRVARRLRR